MLASLWGFTARKRAQPHGSYPPPGASCQPQLPGHCFTHIPQPNSHPRAWSQAQQHLGLAQLHRACLSLSGRQAVPREHPVLLSPMYQAQTPSCAWERPVAEDTTKAGTLTQEGHCQFFAASPMLPGHLCSRNVWGNKLPQMCSYKLRRTPEQSTPALHSALAKPAPLRVLHPNHFSSGQSALTTKSH